MSKSRIARHGHQLMSLASIAMFAISATWLFGVIQLLMAAEHQPAQHVIQVFGARIDDVSALALEAGSDIWWAALTLLSVLLATVWPWASLRRLGAALYRHPPVSTMVASRLQQLGYALAGSAVLTVLITPLLSGLLSHGKVVTAGLSSTFFILTVAATCAFTMALIMREAVRLAEENQSFV